MRFVIPAILAAALPSLAAAQSFDGLSVGGQLSYGDAETEGPALSGEDVLYGLRAYYDADLGNFLLGGGLQYDGSEIDLDGAATIDSVLRLAARAGVAPGDMYFYGTAGFAQASTSGAADPGDSDGFFIGVGYEDYIADQVTVGAEVLYHQFNDFDNIDTLEADVTTVGVNVNYRF